VLPLLLVPARPRRCDSTRHKTWWSVARSLRATCCCNTWTSANTRCNPSPTWAPHRFPSNQPFCRHSDAAVITLVYAIIHFSNNWASEIMLWLGGRVLRMPDLWSTGRGLESRLPRCECNLGQVAYTQVPLSSSSIICYQPMDGDARRLGR